MNKKNNFSSKFMFTSLEEQIKMLSKGEVSPVELVEATAENISDLNPIYNFFSSYKEEKLLQDARKSLINKEGKNRNEEGVLSGIPISIKDLISTQDYPTQFGSKITKGNNTNIDAPSVRRIKKSGGIILGKTTTSEFGCKAVGDSPLTGITRNPWNKNKTPGGSSCGAASLVASGVSPVAIGTDGGGSIRIPSALSGLFGIKGQFGRVPIFPVSATPTLAHVGPLSRTVMDSAIMMSVISGYDPKDPFSIQGRVPNYIGACKKSLRPLRIAWSKTLGYASPSNEVVQLCQKAVSRLENMGCIVENVDKVMSHDPIDMWVAEFYAGVGTKLKDALESRRDDLDPAVAEVLEQAVSQSMGDYYKNVFERYEFRENMRKFFDKYDVLITPTVPTDAFDVGLSTPKELSHRSIVSWVYYTYPFNLTGQPAASIPVGLTSNGLPVGMQVISRLNDEETLFNLAANYEKEYPWEHV
jgi:Asp-tRNA(Asn)/Glu-tRNA(Gln) amidotransferase A subunit family amidase